MTINILYGLRECNSRRVLQISVQLPGLPAACLRERVLCIEAEYEEFSKDREKNCPHSVLRMLNCLKFAVCDHWTE